MGTARITDVVRKRLGLAPRARSRSVHGATLLMPGDHALAQHVHDHPKYSWNAAEIAAAVSEKYPGSPMIDVGANIGDTSTFWRQVTDAPILAVEGDAFWHPYLEHNLSRFDAVTIAKVFVGPDRPGHGFELDRQAGTTRLVSDEHAAQTEFVTVESLLKEFPEFKPARLVKVDTDGFDYMIVEAFLSAGLPANPVYFFEHDPSFSQSGRADSESLRAALVEQGYTSSVWWDNFGNLLGRFDLADQSLWRALTAYVPATSAAYYWDVAAFSAVDEDLAERVSSSR